MNIKQEATSHHNGQDFIHIINELKGDRGSTITDLCYQDLCELIETSTSSVEVFSIICAIGREHQFDYTCSVSPLFTFQKKALFFIVDRRWEWVDHYRTYQLFHHDPSFKILKTTNRHFLFNNTHEIKNWQDKLGPHEKRVISDGQDFGMNQVVHIPVFANQWHKGMFRFIKTNSKPLSEKETARFIHHFSYIFNFAYQKLEHLLQQEYHIQSQKILTPAESQVLNLYALGYDFPSISRLKSRSEATIRTQAKNAREKLQAKNMAHAISQAILLGEVHL